MINEGWTASCAEEAWTLGWVPCPGGAPAVEKGAGSGGVEPYRKVILPPAPAQDEDVFEIELPQDYTDDELAALALAAIRVIYYS